MAKAIKIIVIAKSIDGGTGTFFESISNLSDYYHPEKCDILPLVLERPLYRKIKQKNMLYFTENPYPLHYTFSLQNIILFFRELLWFHKQWKTYKPHLVLSIDSHCNILTLLLTRFFFPNTKTVITTHNFLSATLTKKSSSILKKVLMHSIRSLYSKADAIVGVSKGVVDDVKKITGIKKNTHVIYYGIKKPLPTSIHHTIKKQKNTILTLTRLVEQKDTITLIKAFYLLQKEKKECKLWIVGDGPLKTHLENLTRSLHLEKNITFLGWRKNISSLLRKADIFVLSSYREGLPFSLLEALAHKLPVVSTNTPYGPQEIIKNNTYGILTPIGDEVAMKNNILTLLNNPTLYQHYVKQAETRSAFFTEERMLYDYKKLLDKLLK